MWTVTIFVQRRLILLSSKKQNRFFRWSLNLVRPLLKVMWTIARSTKLSEAERVWPCAVSLSNGIYTNNLFLLHVLCLIALALLIPVMIFVLPARFSYSWTTMGPFRHNNMRTNAGATSATKYCAEPPCLSRNDLGARGALNFFQVGVCGPDFWNVGLVNWFCLWKRVLWTEIFKFGAWELNSGQKFTL